MAPMPESLRWDEYPEIVNPYDNLRPGDRVPGYIGRNMLTLSFFIALFGFIAVLECLWRRTHANGHANIIYTILASIAMGTTLFGVQNISYRSTNMGWGDASMAIVQDPIYVTATYFGPCLAYYIVFILLPAREEKCSLRSVAASILGGLIAVGTVFGSQFGVSNYTYEYDWKYTVISSSICFTGISFSIGAAHYMRSYFRNMWNKNLVLSFIMTGSLISLHWGLHAGAYMIAKVDERFASHYTVQKYLTLATYIISIVVFLSIVASASYGRRYRKKTTLAARQLMVASLTLTPCGKIMVRKDGTLPCEKVCDYFNEGVIEKHINKRSSTFAWLWRASRDWSTISGFIDIIRSHCYFILNQVEDRKPEDLDQESQGEFLKEATVLAFEKVAKSMYTTLEHVGLLHDEFLRTGNRYEYILDEENDIERLADCPTKPKGKLMLLVRQIGEEEMKRLKPHGFRFADMKQIDQILAWEMQTTKDKVAAYLERAFPSSHQLLNHVPWGNYIGCFAARPSIGGSFEIAVDPILRSQIPLAPIEVGIVSIQQNELLQRYHKATLLELFHGLENDYATSTHAGNKRFMREFVLALKKIVSEFEPELWNDSRFNATPTPIPAVFEDGRLVKATVYSLQTMLPADAPSSKKKSGGTCWAPIRFLQAQQRVMPEDHYRFHMQVAKEYAAYSKAILHKNAQEKEPKKWYHLPMFEKLIKILRGNFSGQLPEVPSPTYSYPRRGSDASDTLTGTTMAGTIISDDDSVLGGNKAKAQHIEQAGQNNSSADSVRSIMCGHYEAPLEEECMEQDCYIDTFLKSTALISQGEGYTRRSITSPRLNF